MVRELCYTCGYGFIQYFHDCRSFTGLVVCWWCRLVAAAVTITGCAAAVAAVTLVMWLS